MTAARWSRVDGGDEMDVIGDWAPGQPLLVVDIDERRRVVQVARTGRDWLLTTRGAAHRVVGDAAPCRRADAAHDREGAARPVPLSARADAGAADALEVAEGDKVEAGQPLAVVEAMKMENILRAEKAGDGQERVGGGRATAWPSTR